MSPLFPLEIFQNNEKEMQILSPRKLGSHQPGLQDALEGWAQQSGLGVQGDLGGASDHSSLTQRDTGHTRSTTSHREPPDEGHGEVEGAFPGPVCHGSLTADDRALGGSPLCSGHRGGERLCEQEPNGAGAQLE